MSAVVIHHLLIAALMTIESGGQPNPDHALGDFVKGRPTAFGCLQISEGVLVDVSRFTGQQFTPRDAFDRPTAIKICLAYVAHYCTAERLHHEPTTEDFARCWNGGPSGPLKPDTLAYWVKVKRELDSYAGVWDATYMNFTPARLHVGRTKQRSRAVGPLTAHRFEPLPKATSDDRCRPTERPNVIGFRAGGSFR